MARRSNSRSRRTKSPRSQTHNSPHAQVDPFAQEELERIFKINPNQPDRLISRESSTLEFKENFGWKSISGYARTMAAFANTRGGYIVFGITDSPRIIAGLNNDSFDNIDPQKLTQGLNALFSPEIRWEQHLQKVRGKRIGLIYVFPSTVKPIMAVNTEGDVREAEIYYRYAGRTEKIKYPELRQLLDDQRRRETDIWLRHLSQIAKAGVENVAVMDTNVGTLMGPTGRSFIIDKELLSQLKFIREGEFREVGGAPTLKLIGDLQAVPTGFIQPTREVGVPYVMRTANLVYAFLDQEDVNDPVKYIEQVCHEASGFWPVYYFIQHAKLPIAEVVEVVENTRSRMQGRTKLLQRLSAQEESFLTRLPGTDRPLGVKKAGIVERISAKVLDPDVQPDEIIHVLQTIRCLEANDIVMPYLGPLLKEWFDRYYMDKSIKNVADNLRRAICHLDCILFRDGIRQTTS